MSIFIKELSDNKFEIIINMKLRTKHTVILTDEYHDILRKNWEKNSLSNIILSSATLPCEKDIFPMILNYKQKFPDSNKYEIISYECKKTIPILDSKGNIVMPHYNFDNVKDLWGNNKTSDWIFRCCFVKWIFSYKSLENVTSFFPILTTHVF